MNVQYLLITQFSQVLNDLFSAFKNGDERQIKVNSVT